MNHSHHPSFQPTCGICNSLSGPEPASPIYEDELWHVRHLGAPYPVVGWMMLLTKRHVAGVAHFNDREAASFGHVLRHLEKVLEEITGAQRIYTAAMGESNPHFHCHMVPRYEKMHGDASAWGVFDLQRQANNGDFAIDEMPVKGIIAKYHQALIDHPPPRG